MMNTKKEPQGSSRPRKTLSCALVSILALTLLLPINLSAAYAAPTAAEKQAEADEASAALAAAESQAEQATDSYFTAAIAHEEALAAMDEAQARGDAAEAIIVETQARLGSRAHQMYKDGPLNFLNVIFGASSFEEFTTSWELINVINQENATLIQNNKDARAEAQAAHEEFSAQERAAAEHLAEVEAAKAKAEELVAEQQSIVASLSAEALALLDEEQAARVEVIQQNTIIAETPSYTGNPIPSEGYSDVVSAAYSRIGTPYEAGGTGPDSFDCSGFTSWCYSQAGRGSIGRSTYAQYANASASWPYASGGAAPGDVLYWPESIATHVAIYIGGGQFIHAPLPGQTVCVSSWEINSTIVLRF
ncbi:MAG: C40 family peptidase [Coriobacteriales bacterium]|jgi:cell wall-associated NlpC family hydrolase|nr:C40 family peptidase [Coriobacteriales bacterium]